MEVSGVLHPSAALSPGNSPLDGPQGRSQHCGAKFLLLPRVEPQFLYRPPGSPSLCWPSYPGSTLWIFIGRKTYWTDVVQENKSHILCSVHFSARLKTFLIKQKVSYVYWKILTVKAIPVVGRGSPQGCETSRLPHVLDSRLTDGGEVVSLTRRPPFTLRKIPGTHFC
jgi:hypothetical protein